MARTTRIHVNQHAIRANKKGEEPLRPVITAKDYKQNRTGHRARLLDAASNVVAEVVYSPNHPLDCGAHVWIETKNAVEIEAF